VPAAFSAFLGRRDQSGRREYHAHCDQRPAGDDGPAGLNGDALIVTRDLWPATTARLAMSDGRQAALAGTVIGPSRHASHRPVVSVAPASDLTTSRQRTFSGTPRTVSRMLVPHDVATNVAVACTCEARLAPDSVTGGLPLGRVGDDPLKVPLMAAAATATDATAATSEPASPAVHSRLAYLPRRA
jgi:hypothetical protein